MAKKGGSNLRGSTQQGRLAAKRGKKIEADGGVKKKRRYRPGGLALREIRMYQNSTNLLVSSTLDSNGFGELLRLRT